MRRPLLVFLLLLPLAGFAQDLTALLQQALRSESAFKEEEALYTYRQALRLQPRNIFALCKCADLSCRIGARQTDKGRRADYFKAGRIYAEAAYRLAPENDEVNIVQAFSLARVALISGAKEKVAAASAIKQYAENAIRINPGNFKGWHILGRWNYEVSGLNTLEKTLARWFYGAIPEASLKTAIADYEKSLSLKPDFLLNYLELARACHRDGQNARAIRLLQDMDRVPDKMLDDARVRAEGKKLLKEWT